MMLGRASGIEHDLVCLEARCDSRAPAAARADLAKWSHLGTGVGDAMLVVSELVSNAVRHSGTEQDQRLRITVRRVDRELVISVRDSGISGSTADISTQESASSGGLGLRIVDQLSTDWGTTRETGSYTVWAKVPLE